METTLKEGTNLNQISKLEEFFSAQCKDEVFEAINEYPQQKSVIID